MRRKCLWLAAIVLLGWPQPADAQVEISELELAVALLPLPLELRSDATVFSFAVDGQRIEHRVGDNGFACAVDRELSDGISVLCYQDSLLPYESRRRELVSQEPDVPFSAILERLDSEVRDGILSFPSVASRFYLQAPPGCLVASTGLLCDEAARYYELITPWQTGSTLGLPEEESSGLPWVMFSGGIMAHVMVELPLEPE